jgi:hypothetical protein
MYHEKYFQMALGCYQDQMGGAFGIPGIYIIFSQEFMTQA